MSIRKKVRIFITIFFIISIQAKPQITKDSIFINPKRLKIIIIAESAAFAGSLYLLNNLWYKDYPRSSFHLFNDNREWFQVDKVAHASTTYTLGELGYRTLKWCGVKNNKAIWYGGSFGSMYLLTIEILDGFSSEWGFSIGDFTANTLGSAFFMSQQFAWNEQRIKFIRSYHTTQFSRYRPDLLGKDITETWLKDYNGQTYWLSGNIYSLLGHNSNFPKWFNISLGYSAEGMLGGYFNPETYNGSPLPYFDRYRQFYLSPDIDLTKIKTRSQLLKGVLYALSMLKFPAPALELSRNKFHFIPIYF